MTVQASLLSHARAMRKEPSRAERALWKLLRDRRLEGLKFRRQHPIDRYIADFACVSRKLVVEVDGPSHMAMDQAAYDEHRTVRLRQLGWRVLRLSDSEVLSDERAVVAKILAALQ